MPLSVSQDSSPPRLSPSVSNAKEKSPALQGATRAFNANAGTNASNGTTGSLAAAAFVVRGGRGPGQTYDNEGLSPMSRQTTGQNLRSQDTSPSHVAANLAASQALNRLPNSRDPGLAHRQSWRRPSPLQKMPTGPSTADEQAGGMPSPLTKSLVQLYESKKDMPSPRTQSVRYNSESGPPIRSPKPVRPLARSASSASGLASSISAPLAQTRPHALLDPPNASRYPGAPAATKLAGPVYETAIGGQGAQLARLEPPQASLPRREDETMEEGGKYAVVRKPKPRLRPSEAPTTRLDGAAQSAQHSPNVASDKPKSISTIYPQGSMSVSASSSDSLVPTPPKPLSHPAKPPLQPTRSLEKIPPYLPILPPRMSREHTRQPSTHMSVDSLANAMVASSLASSRAPSPTKPVPIPPPPRRHHLFHRNQSQELISRTPSPAKTMRHTMRKPLDSDDEMNGYKKGRSHLVRKHQHKHHEGDRKRYRTEVTERERKRYEGVWAANRGLLIPSDADPATLSNAVLNIVVKDIWRRSRLPDDVLEEVWDLVVGSEDTDRLGREEFVVGMWLIDQRLKGNKLPIKVSESVWASVRRLPGIKVPQSRH